MTRRSFSLLCQLSYKANALAGIEPATLLINAVCAVFAARFFHGIRGNPRTTRARKAAVRAAAASPVRSENLLGDYIIITTGGKYSILEAERSSRAG